MNRHVVAGMLGLVLAGCATTRQDEGQKAGPVPTVGLTEFPSIHEAINAENARINPAELRAERLNGPGRPISNDPRLAANGPRPAPFTEVPPQAAARPRAVAAAEPPAPRTAAVPASTPAEPRVPLAARPPANPQPPMGQPDPAVASRPDAMPNVEVPAPRAEVLTAAEDKPAVPSSDEARPTTPPPTPAPEIMSASKAETLSPAELPKPAPPADLASVPKAEALPPAEMPKSAPEPETVTVSTTAPAPASLPASAPAPEPAPPGEAGARPSLGSLMALPDDIEVGKKPAGKASRTVSTPTPTSERAMALPAASEAMPVGESSKGLAPDLAVTPEPPPAVPAQPPTGLLELPPHSDPKPEAEAGLPPAALPAPAPIEQPAPVPAPASPASEPPLPVLPPDLMTPDTSGRAGTERPTGARPDPSLSAEPDVMPPLPPLPGSVNEASAPPARPKPKPLKDAQAAPASASVEKAAMPPDGDEPGTVPAIDLPPLPPLDPKEALPEAPALGTPPTTAAPSRREAVPADLPLPVMPPATAMPAAPAAGKDPIALAANATEAPAPKVDPAVQPASATATAVSAEIRSTGRPVDFKEAGRAAAVVGDEVITMHELTNAMRERARGQRLSPDASNELARDVLDTLIDQSVVIQDAKRLFKNPKQSQMLNDAADKVFRDSEIPGLMRKANATNEYELKKKMAEQGVSLDDMRERFRRDFLCRGYLEQKLGHKMNVELPEKYAYYDAHKQDFDEPARITWREVAIEVGKSPSRVEAKKKADAVLDRLRRGEDFAEVVRTASDGPNRSSGGLWETSPGSYAVAEVNEALGRLPLNQISPVIESPGSYHVVRVEKVREAGPAPFSEVQDKINGILRQAKVRRESEAFFKKLRSRTVVTTMFDEKKEPAARADSAVPLP